jgi:hypothetical protein
VHFLLQSATSFETHRRASGAHSRDPSAMLLDEAPGNFSQAASDGGFLLLILAISEHSSRQRIDATGSTVVGNWWALIPKKQTATVAVISFALVRKYPS